jgi:hypothetical protein
MSLPPPPFSLPQTTAISSSAMLGLSVRLPACAHLIDAAISIVCAPLPIENGAELRLTWLAHSKTLRGRCDELSVDVVAHAYTPLRAAKLLERALWGAVARPDHVLIVTDDSMDKPQLVSKKEVDEKLK